MRPPRQRILLIQFEPWPQAILFFINSPLPRQWLAQLGLAFLRDAAVSGTVRYLRETPAIEIAAGFS